MAIVKMINNKSQSIQGLLCVIAYACKDAKTNHEGQQLISGINCVPSLAFDEFMTTKRLYKQDDGRMFYHMVQSFSPEENITPEVAHEIACKFADAIPGFEIVVATHCDADHVHSHFVINSVSFETGKKYHSDPQSIQSLWDASDKLCLQYGLSVITERKKTEHKMNDREYRAYDRGNSWKMALEIAIDDCMTMARNKNHFIRLMEFRGYEVTWSDSRKNITYTTPQGYKCRDRKLNGRKYLKEEIEFEFELRKEICRRYAGCAERNLGAGGSGAENRRRHGTQLEGADLVPDADGRSGSANPRAAGSTATVGNAQGVGCNYGGCLEQAGCAGDPGRTAGYSQSADPDADRTAEANNRSNESVSPADSNCYRGGSAEDCAHDDFDRSTLWAVEREVFECNLRAAIANEKVDASVSSDQPHPQCTAAHPAVDAAYLTANLLNIFDDDDEVEDCTTRYYGPTLSM